MSDSTYIDLFAGCGGLSLGLHNAGWSGLFAVEKSKDAFATLKHNLIDKKQHFMWPSWLPIQNLDINNLLTEYKDNLISLRGNVTMVAGGPPCQGFSTAGRRKEGDLRNNLVEQYLNFIELVKPTAILFENVKGITVPFKKNGISEKVYSTYLIQRLEEQGYAVTTKVLDLSEYGIPQKRIRFIAFGILKELKIKNDFFDEIYSTAINFSKDKNISLKNNVKDAISDLAQSHGTITCKDRKMFRSGLYGNAESNYQMLMRENLLQSPDSHSFANHTISKKNLLTQLVSIKNNNKTIALETKNNLKIKKRNLVSLCEELPTPTITTLPDDYIHYNEPRILTVREYARIQSFPDWYEFKGAYTTGGEARKHQVPRYSQIGNAIPPLFGEICGITLKKLICQ